MDLNGTSWWEELERTLGAGDLGRMYNDVEEAWANLRMDPVLLNNGALSMEESLLECHFIRSMLLGEEPTQHSR